MEDLSELGKEIILLQNPLAKLKLAFATVLVTTAIECLNTAIA